MLLREKRSWGIGRSVHTSIVDKNIDVALAGLDLLESFLDRLVTGEVDLNHFDGVGRFRTFLMEGLDGEFRLF